MGISRSNRLASAALVAGGVLLAQSSAFAQAAPPPAAAPPAMPATTAPATAPASDPAAAPAAAAPATSSGDEVSEQQKKEDGYGLLGPVRVGPLIGLVGLPRPVDLGLYAKYKRYVAAGVSYSFLPINYQGVKFYAFEVQGRWFPFKGSFFLGAGLAFQTLSGETTQGTGTLVADFSQTYIVPRLGWQWMWDSGFTLGLDMGVQLPIASSGSLAMTGGTPADQLALADTQKSMQDAADLVGKIPLPNIELLRIGFLF